MATAPEARPKVLFSPACERNKQPICELLRRWLPQGGRVLEIGSGSGQHAEFFCQQLSGLEWQPSELGDALADLSQRINAAQVSVELVSVLKEPLELDVDRPEQWPSQPYDAVFSANTTHIMAATSVPHLLAGAAQVLKPGGLLLLYGPFLDGGLASSVSNRHFDACLRQRNPAMGLRDARQIERQAASFGLRALVDLAMPAHNRTLILGRDPAQGRSPAG